MKLRDRHTLGLARKETKLKENQISPILRINTFQGLFKKSNHNEVDDHGFQPNFSPFFKIIEVKLIYNII